jgi:predicted transcriptional regulator
MGTKARRVERLLTEVELELMTILWERGGGTVADVLDALPKERPLAYTSVSTMLRILEQKGVVKSEKMGRGHRYVPLVARDDYQAFALEEVVGKVFGGEPLALVRRLFDTRGLSRDEVAALKGLLQQKARGRQS